MYKLIIATMVIPFIMFLNVCDAKNNKYEEYLNIAASYELLYPKNILYPQGESGNYMGQVFKSIDSDAILYTFGKGNPDDLTIEDIYDNELNPNDKDERVFTYKVLRDNWFVISGVHNKKIFYVKTFISDTGLIKTIRFRYDRSKSKVYDKVISIISKSFKEANI